MAPVIDIKDLSTHIQLTKSVVQAVGNVDLHIEPGETLGLVGESGCGKSMTGLSIMGLLPPGGSIVNGSIKLDGRELAGLPDAELRRIRGNEIAMIFQDPLTSLEPDQDHRLPGRRAGPAASRRQQEGGTGPGGRGARPGGTAQADRAPLGLPAPAVRRPAPARDDRDGAVLRAEAAHRRRADDGPGRDHSGPDPGPAGRPEVAARHGHAADYPRHGRDRRPRGPGQRHVRGPPGRGNGHLHPLQPHAPPLHPGAAGVDPAAGPGRREAAGQHTRPAAGPVQPAAGVPLRGPVQPGR